LTAIVQLPFEDVTAKQNLEMNITIHGVKVTGANLDDETRCAHYHGERDVIAIKFRCCERWFSCYKCHDEFAGHAAEIWTKRQFGKPAILCGSCGHQLTINEYLACDAVCPNCHRLFNAKCVNHHHLYFEPPS